MIIGERVQEIVVDWPDYRTASNPGLTYGDFPNLERKGLKAGDTVRVTIKVEIIKRKGEQ